jgi:NADH dehydrogenase FAD-containing subunit
MTTRIVVVGAGYAGLAAAKLAARWTGAEVTLVNAGDRFVERVRLHQLAAGQPLRDLPLAGLLRGTGVRLVVDRVTGIDAATRTVRLGERELGYDRLVYAAGSQADLDSCRARPGTPTRWPRTRRPPGCARTWPTVVTAGRWRWSAVG